MTKTIIVIGDQHAHPDFNNDRADWLGRLIADIKPDTVVNIGDCADMTSLAEYDRNKRSFHGKTYERDINSHLDFQDRLWAPVRKLKKKMPRRIVLEGNHEVRVERALDINPQLQGSVGFQDFRFEDYYDEVIRYNGILPGVHIEDGIAYAHYFSSGVLGRPIGGEHIGYSLLTKKFMSCTQGHTHTMDYSIRTLQNGKKIHGLSLPVYQDYWSPWGGDLNNLWNRGVIIKRNVENGNYDLQVVSIETLRKEYS